MAEQIIYREYDIAKDDFTLAGEASSDVRKLLTQLGVSPQIVKRTSIAMYEAEINTVIHGGGGKAHVHIDNEKIIIKFSDNGPGIEDIDMAMKEGFSTASDYVRGMGFGAGMGLPNIKKQADAFTVKSEIGKGTEVLIEVRLK